MLLLVKKFFNDGSTAHTSSDKFVRDPIHAVGMACDGATVLEHPPYHVNTVSQCTVPTLHGPLQLIRPKDQLSLRAVGWLCRV